MGEATIGVLWRARRGSVLSPAVYGLRPLFPKRDSRDKAEPKEKFPEGFSQTRLPYRHTLDPLPLTETSDTKGRELLETAGRKTG